MLSVGDSNEWNQYEDQNPRVAMKSKISEAIGKQISKKHEWLPETVVGRSGLRPLDSLSAKDFQTSNVGLSYSREGIKNTQTLCQVPSNVETNDSVTEQEWEVSIHLIR